MYLFLTCSLSFSSSGQGINTYIDKISIIQKNALRIISFSEFNAHTDPLFRKLKILKIKDNITLQNCLLVYDFINNKLPKFFKHTFNKLKDVHTINTRNARAGNIYIPFLKTTRYGLKSIENWNYFTKHFKDINVSDLSRKKLKKIITDHFLDSYIVHISPHNCVSLYIMVYIYLIVILELIYYRYSLYNLKGDASRTGLSCIRSFSPSIRILEIG